MNNPNSFTTSEQQTPTVSNYITTSETQPEEFVRTTFNPTDQLTVDDRQQRVAYGWLVNPQERRARMKQLEKRRAANKQASRQRALQRRK